MTRCIVDETRARLVLEDGRELDLYSPEAFSLLSRLWLKVSWTLKHPYTFTWLGRPLIQHPEDVLRVQETIHEVAPDVIVETGVAHGGSLVFYATLCKVMGRGRVVGVDVEIRAHNRRAIEAHVLAPLITLVEGDSTAPAVVERVSSLVRAGERVLVILDSNHSRDHVARELEAYAPLVSKGSYIVATDGSMEFLHDVPRGRAEWAWDNPRAAAVEFAKRHPEFLLEEPPFAFNESAIQERVTHWPDAYLRRR